jgi:hypothetical protein
MALVVIVSQAYEQVFQWAIRILRANRNSRIAT